MIKICAHVAIASMILWRTDSIKSVILLLGKVEEDSENGVFIDKKNFEPFYIPQSVNSLPISMVIKLFNKN